jgi:hypothetical protein
VWALLADPRSLMMLSTPSPIAAIAMMMEAKRSPMYSPVQV